MSFDCQFCMPADEVYPWSYVPPPDGFGYTPPFPILQNGREFKPNDGFKLVERAAVPQVTTYYVATGGADGNTGLSWAQALRTLNVALGKAGVTRIYVETGYYYWNQSGSGANINVSVEIIASGGPVYFTTDIYNLIGAFVLVGNHYEAASPAPLDAVYDATFLDSYGDDVPLTLQPNVAAVDANPGSWYFNAGTVYIRTTDSRVPDVSLRYFYGTNAINCARDNKTLYLEGLHFRGGSGAYFANASAVGGMRVYAQDCSFKYATSTSAECCLCEGVTEVIFRDCIAAKAQADGFHYNILNTINSVGIEIDCISYDNGIASGFSGNGSSAHNSCTTIRIMGLYYNNKGPNLHDTGSTKNWALGCECHDPQPGGVPPNSRKANFTGGSIAPGATWLDSCYSHGLYAPGGFDLYADGNAFLYYRNLLSLGVFGTGAGATLTTY